MPENKKDRTKANSLYFLIRKDLQEPEKMLKKEEVPVIKEIEKIENKIETEKLLLRKEFENDKSKLAQEEMLIFKIRKAKEKMGQAKSNKHKLSLLQ